MELDKLNKANRIVKELERIKRVMPSMDEHYIDRHQGSDIIDIVMCNQKEFCKILINRVVQLEKEFEEL